ncbi:6,7-dimethyl-8-ribityllumazine synthase [SAR86 cluster bacterium]|jgi:6,7-dimethyl-8-ribityllumazine synthase|nr:6,7-dimethyl-8-ribityllumazine synthase [SAR86 cluster bacterium]
MSKNNPKEFELKKTDYSSYRVLVIKTKWNSEIIAPMVEDCLKELKNQKIIPKIISVPGAYEIPFIANKRASKFDLIITLGAIIKGETPHFDIIAQTISDSIMQTSLNKDTPIIFGVLTTNNIDQAKERAAQKGSELTLSGLNILDNLADD